MLRLLSKVGVTLVAMEQELWLDFCIWRGEITHRLWSTLSSFVSGMTSSAGLGGILVGAGRVNGQWFKILR